MKKLKINILRNITFIILGLVIFSCEKEDVQGEIQQEKIAQEKVTQEKIQNLIKSKVPNAIFPTEEKELAKLEEAKKSGNYMTFKTLKEFSKYLDEQNEYQQNLYQQRDDVLTHEGILTGGGSDFDHTYTFKDSQFVGFGLILYIGFDVTACEGSNINSWLSDVGLTIGRTYQHIDGHFEYSTLQAIGADWTEITGKVSGMWTYYIYIGSSWYLYQTFDYYQDTTVCG